MLSPYSTQKFKFSWAVVSDMLTDNKNYKYNYYNVLQNLFHIIFKINMVNN